MVNTLRSLRSLASLRPILMGRFLLLAFVSIASVFAVTSASGTISQNDLIVDQESASQYQRDDYLRFDAYDDSNVFCGNENPPHGSVAPCDLLDISSDGPILGASFTQEAWVYSDSTTYPHRSVFGIETNPSGNSPERPPTITYHYGGGDVQGRLGQIRYGFGTGTEKVRFIVTGVMADDVWQHIAFTFDGTESRLYVNGEMVHSSSAAAGMVPIALPITHIGYRFLGKIDEVRIWDVARTEEQIQQNMSQRLQGNEMGLVAYYPMDVGDNFEIIDQSPNDNHGIIRDAQISARYFSDDCVSPDGSADCPYPTIRGALDDVQAGERIYIREGRYSELLNEWQLNHLYMEEEEKEEGEKIVIEGEAGANVMLDGTVPINATWEPYNHNGHDILKATLDMNAISKQIGLDTTSIYGVWVNDRYMIPAMPVNFKNPTDPTTGNPDNPEPGTIWALTMTSPTVKDVDYVPGELANLDNQEEWSYDPDTSTLYLYASDNYIPTATNVRVRVRDKFLTFSHSDNIEFKNIHFFAGSFKFYNVSYLTLEDSMFSFSSEMLLEGNFVTYGTHVTVRNSIFEHINDGHPFHASRVMFTLMENVLFRYNDWFKGTAFSPATTKSYRGSGNDIVWGSSIWRYVTVENSYSAGILPGPRSLAEYVRIENLYETCDCGGIQRNASETVDSTTRYAWVIQGPKNGVRFDSSCGGIYGDINHVVSVGNKRGFRLKGDYHEAYHLTAYDNATQDISLPDYKYCGEDLAGSPEIGNTHSSLHNAIAENSLECNSPDCGDPSFTEGGPEKVAEDPAFLVSNGIWYGRALSEQNTNKYAYPHLELADPWINIRDRSEEWLMENVGGLPFDTNIQAYDFRPRKGSNLIDAGVVLPGINDGEDPTEYNHALSFPGQNRRYVGDAPDVGAYEYGDSVYWIPGYRYPHPSAPIPIDGAVNVPLDYSLVWNYPYREDYSGVMATVTVDGPGVSRTETFEYPNNVLFETFKPGGIYNWSVSVDGVSGGEWTFQVDDHVYPLNDRSVDINAEKSALMPYQIGILNVSNDHMAFLRFDIPNSINGDMAVNLNLVPESVTAINGSVVVYRYDLQGWTEKLDDTNIGLMDYSLLTPVAEITGLEPNSQVSLDVSDLISGSGEISFALGVSNPADVVSFYSREKLFKDGKYSPQMSVWPSLTLPSTVPPSPPSNIVAQTGPTSISFTWDANPESDIAGYKVHYDTDAAGYPYAISVDVGDVTSYTITGLTTGTTYYTAVSAYDADGNESWYSSNTTATTESAPTTLTFSTQPSGTTAGSIFTTQPIVAITDSQGNTVTSSTDSVTISITSGTGGSGATLIGTITITAVNGVATFSDLRIDKAATGYTLTASGGSLASAISSTFVVSSATASRLVVISEPSTATAGEAFDTQSVIQIQDAYGNLVTSSSASVTVAITSGTGTSGAALSGSATISAVSGVATFSGLGIDSAGANYTLTATASGLASAVSSSFNVVAATPIPAMSTWGLIAMALLVSAWMAHMARRGRFSIGMR